METTATSKIQGGAKTAHGWPVRHQKGETPEVTVEIKTNNIVNEIDRRALVSSEATARLIETQAHLTVKTSDAAPLKIREIAIPIPDRRRRVSRKKRRGRDFRLVVRITALVSAFGLGWIIGSNLYSYLDRGDEITDRSTVNAVVERIIAVESDGDPNAKNSRSSATGLGQFLNDTWLELIREYRPDLTRGRSESETLELRRDTKLAREITTRLLERNATMLRQRGLPINAGAVYLAHFAGAAGAVAILSASDSADAASVLAGADATGRTKREQLIKANPFLEFAPFWKKAEDLDALIVIHPNGFTEGKRLSRFYFNNTLGNPFETTLALHYLIFDGVLERQTALGGGLSSMAGASGVGTDALMPQPPHRDSGTRRGKNTDDTALANTSEFCNTIPPIADVRTGLRHAHRSSSGNLAIFTAIRRGGSHVSSLACRAISPFTVLKR